MLGFTRRSITVILLVGILKGLLSVLAIVPSDLINFTYIAQYDFISLSHGALPFNGPYTGMGIFLAPFYGLWYALPIGHTINLLVDQSSIGHTDTLLLVLAMKIPIMVFDFLAGALIYSVINVATKSISYAAKGFLMWYVNPYNILMITMWGSVDIVPAVFLLLPILLGYRRQWFLAGLSLAIASILRLFPILLFPALLVAVLGQGRRATAKLALSFLLPLAAVFGLLIVMFGSVQAVVETFAKLALGQQDLIFFGYPLIAGAPVNYNLPLALFMFAIQLYVIRRFWKTLGPSLLAPSLAFLFILFAATPQQIYHFNWVTPLLTADYVINRRRPRLFILLFLSVFMTWLSAIPGLPTRPDILLLLPTYTQGLRNAAGLLSKLTPTLSISHVMLAGIFAGLLLCHLISLNRSSLNPVQTQGFKGNSFSLLKATSIHPSP